MFRISLIALPAAMLATGCTYTHRARSLSVYPEHNIVPETHTVQPHGPKRVATATPTAVPASSPVAAPAAKGAPDAKEPKKLPDALPMKEANANRPSGLKLVSAETAPERPRYGETQVMPIDLPTVLRLVDSKSPSVGHARARWREAEARLEGAEVLWLPNFSGGVGYYRFDGQTQNQRGEVFGTSRANLFPSAGPTLAVDTADAYYRPLIERQTAASENFRTASAVNAAELEAALAYFDLVQVQAQIAINLEVVEKTEMMLKAAEIARANNLDRTAGDVQRSAAELSLRKLDALELKAKANTASARLARLLTLEPGVRLMPAETALPPLTLVAPSSTLDQLLQTAIANRPDLAANRAVIAAAWERVRRAKNGPWLPKLLVNNQTGGFGGGLNSYIGNFEARNALSAQLYWEVKNLGLGNRAETAERRAAAEQTEYTAIDAQARAAADIVEAASNAAAAYDSLALAQEAVREASELYRINKEGTFNVVDAKNLFDALRPLQAIQILNLARLRYLGAVMDFNRAQYRLYTALGRPVHESDGNVGAGR